MSSNIGSENANIYKIITVNASEKYNVIIGKDLCSVAGKLVKDVIPVCRIALITDDNCDKLYSDKIEKSLTENGYKVVKFVFPQGEKSKNINTYAMILNFLAENGITRTDCVVALGGGVAGDLAGFSSATYMRGIKYIQVPLSLLAQIDSSVGGKTAIDLEKGKNLAGAFCQPQLVICDINALDTLPEAVFNDGMGEVIKYALLDEKIFNLLEKGNFELTELVSLCVDYKRIIVEEDEFEGGKRKLLNLGHTIAHAIEKLSGYSIAHGRAVAMGVNIITDISHSKGYINDTTYSRIKSVFKKYLLIEENTFGMREICNSALSDKKRNGDKITLITVHGVGDCRETTVLINELGEFLS